MSEKVGRIRYGLAVWCSHVQASFLRLRSAWRKRLPGERPYGQPERRRNPRACPLCSGPLKRDRRGPRDMRRPDGTIRQLPEETLEWFKCDRCHLGQIGVPAEKLANGHRWAA